MKKANDIAQHVKGVKSVKDSFVIPVNRTK